MASINIITSLLLVFFLCYSMICLSFEIPTKYSILSDDPDNFEKETFKHFQVWKKKNGREYSSYEEEVKRYEIFKSNLKYIREKNSKRNSVNEYRLGLNKFSDLSYEEFSNIYLRVKEDPIIKGNHKEVDESCENAPTSWNWVDEGAVTEVKNQQKCGKYN